WFVGGRKFALRVIRASIERVALAAGSLLNDLAVFAQRAFHADEVFLHVLAIGVSAATDELAIATMTKHHVAPAFGANLFQRNVGHLSALVQAARCFAIGITGAGHELAETPALEHHHPAAVLAVFLLCSLLQVGRVKIGQVDGILFGERATLGIL